MNITVTNESKIHELLSDTKYIFVDVFDTLLYREDTEGNRLTYHSIIDIVGNTFNLPRYHEFRVDAGHALNAAEPYHKLSDIATLLPDRYKELPAIELAVDARMLKATPLCKALIDLVSGTDKEIYILSDVYYTNAEVHMLLQLACPELLALPNVKALLVSGSDQCLKRDLTMYQRALSLAYSIESDLNKTCMISDMQRDLDAANKCGIAGILYKYEKSFTESTAYTEYLNSMKGLINV